MRLPDFIVIGTAKSGTTTLFHWLSEQPEFDLPLVPAVKEPHFFVNEDAWGRGLSWYASLFEHVPVDLLTGEASPGYTRPDVAATAARRMATLVPDVRLVYVLRHPVDRLRSAHRHRLQRAREHLPLDQAVQSLPWHEFLGRSMYWTCLEPYLEVFEREQICVARFEDLVGHGHPAWTAVLHHLGVGDRPPPRTAHNVSAAKPQYPRGVMRLLDGGRLATVTRLPAPVRARGKAILERFGPDYVTHVHSSQVPLPASVVAALRDDTRRLEEWLGVSEPLWDDASWDVAVA